MKKSIIILLLCTSTFNVFSQFKITSDNKIGIGTAPDTNYAITMNNDVLVKGANNNNIRLLCGTGQGGPMADISPSYFTGTNSSLGNLQAWNRVSTNYLMVYNDLILYGSFYNYSDKTLKKDINQLSFDKNLFAQLKPVSYNMVDSLSTVKKNGAKVLLKFEKREYPIKGFIAQDIQQIYPELVDKDSETGLLKIKTLEFIPILVTAIKDQQVQIDTLTKQIEELTALVTKSNSGPKKVGSSSSTTEETDVLTYPVLDQNIPNPFNTATTIGFYLPTTIAAASIYVYDMNGGQLKSISIPERGKGTVTIQGSELTAGMYLYALIADGKVIDTKRMILTK